MVREGSIKVDMNKSVYNDLVLLTAVLGINVRGEPDISATIVHLMNTYGDYCKMVKLPNYERFLEAKAAREGK